MKKAIITGIGLVILIGAVGLAYYFATTRETDERVVETNAGQRCAHAGGTWMQVEKECEYISREWCDAMGGVFNECGSACRNDPNAEVCTAECVPYCALAPDETDDDSHGGDVDHGPDPFNTAYRIDGTEVKLVDGSATLGGEPGSVATGSVSLFGVPVFGDADGDRDDDAAVVLAVDPGGSGTFYYLAVAQNNGDGTYTGTEALLMGDRIAPQTVVIQRGLVIANYATRAEGEAMTDVPSVGVSLYAQLRAGGAFNPLPELAAGEEVLQGYVVVGEGVREFRPCGRGTEIYWLDSSAPVYPDLITEYNTVRAGSVPYTPLFATIIGSVDSAPDMGLAQAYTYGVSIRELVSINRSGSCEDDRIRVDAPGWGATVSSPIEVRGVARGTWFFEGDFPLVLVDWDGLIIAEGYASAEGDWMTESFVPFTGELTYNASAISGNGALILQRDNPSGLPEYDAAVEMPLFMRGEFQPVVE